MPLRSRYWGVGGQPDRMRVLGSGAHARGPSVSFGCGPGVGARTWAVTINDGTGSASLDFVIYLLRRTDGWNVWASY